MILGSLVHSLLLTPGEFSNEFYILPDLDFRTKEGRERKQQLFSDNPGKIAVPEDLMSKGKDIIASCSEDENIRNLLEDSVNEISFFWECPVTHLNFKAKIDGYVQGKYFIELKTTRTAEPSGFSSIINDRNYDLSLVHYMEGIKAFTGVDVPEVYFIAVETSAPFVTQVYRASDDMITLGREKWLNTIVRLKDAISRKKWDGYWYEENTIPTISPPGWAIKKSEALGGQDELWEAI